MNSMNNFLKTKEGLELLLHITAEYGTWNEAKQCYDMPIEEAIEIAYMDYNYLTTHKEELISPPSTLIKHH